MSDKLVLNLDGKEVEITQDDNGRYSLNDLYRFADVSTIKAPSRFLRSVNVTVLQTWVSSDSVLLCTLSESDFDNYVVQTKIDRATVTFAPLEIVYRYAGFISKEFEKQVYRAFTELTKGNVQKAAEIASSVVITPELVATQHKLSRELQSLLSQGKPSSDKLKKIHFGNLMSKVATGFTPKELTGGYTSAPLYIRKTDNGAAMQAYIASLRVAITMLKAGVKDYHTIAAVLGVETNNNSHLITK